MDLNMLMKLAAEEEEDEEDEEERSFDKEAEESLPLNNTYDISSFISDQIDPVLVLVLLMGSISLHRLGAGSKDVHAIQWDWQITEAILTHWKRSVSTIIILTHWMLQMQRLRAISYR